MSEFFLESLEGLGSLQALRPGSVVKKWKLGQYWLESLKDLNRMLQRNPDLTELIQQQNFTDKIAYMIRDCGENNRNLTFRGLVFLAHLSSGVSKIDEDSQKPVFHKQDNGGIVGSIKTVLNINFFKVLIDFITPSLLAGEDRTDTQRAEIDAFLSFLRNVATCHKINNDCNSFRSELMTKLSHQRMMDFILMLSNLLDELPKWKKIIIEIVCGICDWPSTVLIKRNSEESGIPYSGKLKQRTKFGGILDEHSQTFMASKINFSLSHGKSASKQTLMKDQKESHLSKEALNVIVSFIQKLLKNSLKLILKSVKVPVQSIDSFEVGTIDEKLPIIKLIVFILEICHISNVNPEEAFPIFSNSTLDWLKDGIVAAQQEKNYEAFKEIIVCYKRVLLYLVDMNTSVSTKVRERSDQFLPKICADESFYELLAKEIRDFNFKKQPRELCISFMELTHQMFKVAEKSNSQLVRSAQPMLSSKIDEDSDFSNDDDDNDDQIEVVLKHFDISRVIERFAHPKIIENYINILSGYHSSSTINRVIAMFLMRMYTFCPFPKSTSRPFQPLLFRLKYFLVFDQILRDAAFIGTNADNRFMVNTVATIVKGFFDEKDSTKFLDLLGSRSTKEHRYERYEEESEEDFSENNAVSSSDEEEYEVTFDIEEMLNQTIKASSGKKNKWSNLEIQYMRMQNWDDKEDALQCLFAKFTHRDAKSIRAKAKSIGLIQKQRLVSKRDLPKEAKEETITDADIFGDSSSSSEDEVSDQEHSDGQLLQLDDEEYDFFATNEDGMVSEN